MAGNLYQRYVWLLNTISRRQGITFEEIDRRWQSSSLNDDHEPLPKRTFHNHLKAIYDMFHIEIGCQAQCGYKYYIRESSDIDMRDLQASLLSHLQMSNAMFCSPKLQGRVVLDRFQMYRHFSPLITAMEEGVAVKITCRRADRGINNKQCLTLEPYFIKQFDSWFVVGRVQESGKIHAFAFNSIRNIEQTELPYFMPKEFKSMDYIVMPTYNAPDEIVADDNDLFILERSQDRLRRRSRDAQIYQLSDGEEDYADIKVGQNDVIQQLRREQEYRKYHAQELVLAKDDETHITLHSFHPDCEPFINVEQLSELLRIEVYIKDGSLKAIHGKHTEDEPSVQQLLDTTRQWLNASCQEPRFKGSNREFAEWLWNTLEM